MFDQYSYEPGAIQGEQGTQFAGTFGNGQQSYTDLGRGALQNFASGRSGGQDLTSSQLSALGYAGPMRTAETAQGGGELTPELLAFMDSKFGPGWTVGQTDDGSGNLTYRVLQKQGDGGYSLADGLSATGTLASGYDDFVNGILPVALAAIGGATAGGAFGGAGAAGAEGGAALSGMDLAADAGMMGANGIGGAGSMLGLPQASLGAYASGTSSGSSIGNAVGEYAAGLPEVGAAGGGGGGLSSADLAALYGDAGYGATGGAAAAGGGWASSIGNALKGANTFLGDNKSLISLGGNLLGGVMGSNAAGKAADAQRQAGEASNALLKSMYDQNRADNAPLLATRNNALTGLNGLMTNPGSVVNDPGYEFQRAQGQQGIDRRAAAAGNYYSGAQMKAASRYNTDYATTKLDNSYNRLSNMAGLGQVGANNNQASATNYGNQAANNLTGIGNANASGYVGQANAWGNALSGALNNWQQQDLIDRYLKKGP